jgi:uridine kinase
LKNSDAVSAELDSLLKEKKKIVLVIDGRCGAGKTTLAAQLQELYQADVIPMDHFFLRPAQRTEARLAEPGGNIDYERFADEVLEKLPAATAFSYRPYNCSTQEYDPPIAVKPGRLSIIEGSYSMHPRLHEQYALRFTEDEVFILKAFLTVNTEEQHKRIAERSPGKLEQYIKQWIPMEERYFKAFNIEETCDLVLDTGQNHLFLNPKKNNHE